MVNHLLRLSLKVWNSLMGLGGVATVIYAILMFRAASSHHITIPWFVHGFLFVGIVLCAVTCLGNLAANIANNWCLSTYMVIILLLLVLETIIMTNAFLDPKWEKDNESDTLDDSYYTSSYIWKGLTSLVFIIQAICALLAAMTIHLTDRIDDHESENEDDEPDFYLLAPWQQPERNIV